MMKINDPVRERCPDDCHCDREILNFHPDWMNVIPVQCGGKGNGSWPGHVTVYLDGNSQQYRVPGLASCHTVTRESHFLEGLERACSSIQRRVDDACRRISHQVEDYPVYHYKMFGVKIIPDGEFWKAILEVPHPLPARSQTGFATMEEAISWGEQQSTMEITNGVIFDKAIRDASLS